MDIRQVISTLQKRSNRPIQRVLVIGLFAGFGFLALHSSHAATLTLASEAENGVLAGNATTVADTQASGNAAVAFGAAASGPPPISITTFGAVCDGTTDDTAKIQQAFDTVATNQPLQIPAGKACRTTAVIQARHAGLHLTGPGTLLSTNPIASSVNITADNITLDGGLLFKTTGAAGVGRQTAPQQASVSLKGSSGTVIRNVTMDSPAQDGIFNEGGSNFLFEGVTVKNSLADCIHNTHGAHNGTIRNTVSQNCGDDGVAVVSYVADGVICHDITIDSPKLLGQTHGRAFTVVGGQNITYKNVYSENSSSAAIYVATEYNYNTYGVSNIQYLGGTLVNSNQDAGVNHGAVLVTNYQHPAYPNSDVTIRDMTIKDTRAGAAHQVSISGQPNNHIQFINFTITGGPASVFDAGGTPANQYNTTGFTFNGAPVADHIGF